MNHVLKGKQAMEKRYRGLVPCQDPARLTGSMALDDRRDRRIWNAT